MMKAFSNTALRPGAAVKGSQTYTACPLLRTAVITALCRLLVGMPRGHVSGNWMALQTQKSPRRLPTRALLQLQLTQRTGCRPQLTSHQKTPKPTHLHRNGSRQTTPTQLSGSCSNSASIYPRNPNPPASRRDRALVSPARRLQVSKALREKQTYTYCLF